MSEELEELEARVAAALAGERPSEALVELAEELADGRLRRRLAVFTRINRALARLREAGSVRAMIERAPREAAGACGFDRVVVYRVDGGELVAESFFVGEDGALARRLLEFSRAHPAQLREQILESEMVRRRMPMVVHDAQNHPHTYKPLVSAYGTSSYVAAPIMPEGRVIGFVHGDKGLAHPGDPAAVDDFDRDALWAFAEGLGYAIERAQLLERLHAQGRQVRRLIAQTEQVVTDFLNAKVELASSLPEETPAARAAAALFAEPSSALERALSRRELEVLELVAGGATNPQIAEQLVISEDTAKSHVGRILRKLGASNRVEAAGIFLQARAGRGPP